jgi:predicted P-loop ATPase
VTAANGHDPAAAEHIARQLGGASRSGPGWMCKCPVPGHGGGGGDKNASLWLVPGDKLTVVPTCQAGCKRADVLATLEHLGHIEPRQPRPDKPARDKLEGIHVYHDARGEIDFRVHRWRKPDGTKAMPQSRPDGKGGWIKGTGGAHKGALYRLPQLLAAPPDEPVVVVEGEAKVEALEKLGVLATCNAGGAGKWTREHARQLGGHPVIVLPDNDPQGHAHATLILATLPHARTVQLPGLPHKGDILDWLKAGGTPEQLRTLLLEGPPVVLTRAAASDRAPATDAAARSRAPAREGWTAGLIEDGKKWARVEANVVKALREAPELRDRVRYSELAEAVQYRGMPWESDGKWRTWEDVDDTRLAVWLQEKLLFVKHTTCARAVTAVANESRHNPVRDYLAGLRWDGTPRLTDWLITYVGASPGKVDEKSTGEAKEKAEEAVARRLAYIQAVGRKWLISLVARTFRPGCQADHMLVLEGPQGARKTSLLRAVLPESDWFLAAKSTFGTKDSLQDLRGKTLVEFGELAAMGRGQIREIKDFITCTIDTYRPSFGARPRDFKRRCVCAGSTNELTYLLDDTGNRRFWCVRVGIILLESFVEDRDQILAEAVAAFHGGEEWHLDVTLEGTAAEEQEERRVVLPWEELIANWLAHPEQSANSFTSNQILDGAIRMHPADRDRAAQTQVGHVMRLLGWESYRPHGGDRIRRYRRPTPVQPG